MQFLILHSDMACFTSEGNKFRWEMPNLELNSNGQFALSSMVIMSTSPPPGGVPVIVSTSLVESDEYNSDGIVLIRPTRTGTVAYAAESFEFWNLDSCRPRNVMFTLRGLDSSTVSFISVVLACA